MFVLSSTSENNPNDVDKVGSSVGVVVHTGESERKLLRGRREERLTERLMNQGLWSGI